MLRKRHELRLPVTAQVSFPLSPELRTNAPPESIDISCTRQTVDVDNLDGAGDGIWLRKRRLASACDGRELSEVDDGGGPESLRSVAQLCPSFSSCHAGAQGRTIGSPMK